MAKIIQFKGWYQIGKEEILTINADYITTITTTKEKGKSVTCLNIFSSSPEVFAPPIYTDLSIDEVVKLINK